MKLNSKAPKKFFIKENIWIVLLSYVLIILFTRAILYFSSVRWGIFSGLIIKGVHYHHYFWGYFILLIGLMLYRTSFRAAGLMAIGIGTGYICDELTMLFSFGSIGYWSLWSLVPITFGLLVLNFIFFLCPDMIDEKAKQFNLEEFGKRFQWYVKWAQKILFSRFGPVRKETYKPLALGYVVTLVLFLVLVSFIIYASAERLEDNTFGVLPCESQCSFMRF
ncbi:MAG: hypothetical protein COV41_01220 [Candidatus Brennerbacteria bacterium CG11_big_fil_rev_8_21_14_0_20_43_10]|uniref:Uncharacterized protein n=3 Tax=Candidatus Brenneribacteriota TaxID=1817902 RepID=A0A2M8C3P0_9BACT|nr:MAG: hypothetical protein AUJ43_02635 [Parcubacteria group bacterium CG1_02_44_31]PIP50465.1 MAG: hypothetical protein COX12_01185 [Candidatus Brennerbacteria bacterium CG23_combo_of_CG06-09_8_20_14_all_44_41]PIR26545.1 MAG: hypothetical protein COV41_01220 [Candidatus Brennerbacteria bacterium CG11_big_fil_rev_8_21_14_0_20_43_10]PIX28922.1 MAG: hypothetical protein COZ64_01525 [Candidatus Brennerbacteria bacterium CG_4_8_14_3_um_filter_43_14]PJA18916.1 MAG: hypothetical protein COX61_02510 